MGSRRRGSAWLGPVGVTLVAASCSLAGLLPARDAHAQASGDEATRLSARQLGDEGTRLFDAGDYAGALDRFQRADALVPRQTLGLRVARCLVKLGRFTEAYERYVAVARMPVAAGLEPDIVALQNDAKSKAEAEGVALAPRIPSVVVDVKDATPPVVVTIDGNAVPAALFGVKRAVDPGSHVVVATSAGRTTKLTVVVKEGETVPVVLKFEGAAAPVGPVVVGPPPPIPPPDAPAEPRSSTQRTAGIALLVVGGAGILIGAGIGGAAVAKKSSLSGPCGPNLQCPKASWDDADAYNRLRIATTASLVTGAAVAAIGGVVLGTAPKAGTAAPSTGVWIGPRGAGLRGSF